LVTEFEGKFQEIVDDDVAKTLVAFARSERGTQIVLGASRPRSALRPLGGVVENVLRHTPGPRRARHSAVWRGTIEKRSSTFVR